MQSCKLFGTSRLAGGFLFIQEKRKLPLPFPSGNNMDCRDRIPDPFY